MANIKHTCVSLDSEYFQVKKLSGTSIAVDLLKANGWISNKVKYPNVELSCESRVVDPNHLARTLLNYCYTSPSMRENWYTKKSYWIDSSTLFKLAGLSKYLPNSDRVKCQARDIVVDYSKTNGGIINYERIDIATDIELECFDGFDIDNFFLLQLSKSQNINSPFMYFTGDDGSRTYYLMPLKDPNDRKCKPKNKNKKPYVPQIRKYMYLKHLKEGLRNRFILRYEVSYTNLTRFGADSDKLIKYIAKDFKTMRLFCFDDVETGNEFKELYQANIPKESPNVPPKLLREIKSKADNEFDLRLPEEIKAHIHNVLAPKPVEKPTWMAAHSAIFGKSKKREEPKQVEVEPTKKANDRDEPKQVEVEPISMEIRNRIRNLTKRLKSEKVDTHQNAESGV